MPAPSSARSRIHAAAKTEPAASVVMAAAGDKLIRPPGVTESPLVLGDVCAGDGTPESRTLAGSSSSRIPLFCISPIKI